MNLDNPRIAFITSGHSPFSSRLFSKELKSLQKRYSNLTAIAPYHETETVVDGIRVIGIKKYRSRYNRWSTLFSLYKHAVALHPHIVHCHEPDSLLVAYLLKKRFPEIRVIYDCHEFHPYSFTENFYAVIRLPSRKIIEQFENYLASKVDAVITVNERLVDRFRKSNDRVVLLPNYPRSDIVSQMSRRRKLFENNEVRLIYAGGLSADRGVFRMLKVIKALENKLKVRLILIGKFPSSYHESEFWKKVEELDLSESIEFKGYLSHEKTFENLMDADIGLFLLYGRERYNWGEPMKYFEYSAAGLPVIMSDLQAKRALIEHNRNGILVSSESENNSDVIKAIMFLYENKEEARAMLEMGKHAFLSRYNWEIIEDRLLRLYEHVQR